MNVNSSNSKSLSQCEVRSKYFTENPVMDESSDFQEKKNFAAPKKIEKASTKTKPKKAIKRIKGQKDIRSALKSKKNELVTFSNDFDKICKQSGIDVDPEQLQIAIALSKSLQQSEDSESSTSQSSRSLTSQERTGKIRTTLLEYGFKVPEIKITATKSRKLKRHRKNYKLLLASESEKQQVISDRYSQILFHNINTVAETLNINETSDTKVPLYHIATNTPYEVLKSNYKLYVNGLIEINQASVGGLLRDWSDIPGRPATPQLELPDINFSDIDCSQEELDTILAGTLKSAQDLVKEKYKLVEKKVILRNIKVNTDKFSDIDLKMDATKDTSYKPSNLCYTTSEMRSIEGVDTPVITLDSESPHTLLVTSQVRSCSPDIFDDEVSSIMDSSKENTEPLSQENLCRDVTKHISHFMDLTDCVNIASQNNPHNNNTTLKIGSRVLSQLSQEEKNKTKRKSNDFMEITECVATSSQPKTNKAIEEVDLTQDLIQSDATNFIPTESLKDKEIESMDLTQSSSSSNVSLPFVQISGRDKNFDDTIILTEDAYVGKTNDLNDEISGNNNSPKSYTINDLQNSKNHNMEDNSLVLVDIESDGDGEVYKCNEKHNEHDYQSQQKEITLPIAVSHMSPVQQFVSKSQSFFDDFDHPHSDSSKERADDDIVCNIEPQKDPVVTECFTNQKINDEDIDLTQSSGSSVKSYNKESNMHSTNKGTKNQLDNNDVSLIEENDNCYVNDTLNDDNCYVNDTLNDDKLTNDIDLTQTSSSSIGNIERKEIDIRKETLEDEICVIESHDRSSLNDSINDDNHDIDLTQSPDSSTEQVESCNSNFTAKDNSAATKVSDTNSLGKIGDVSIDYDEIFDDMIASHTNQSNSYKSESNEVTETNDSTEKLTRESHSASNCSQNSDVFEICDEELNYSMNRSRHEIVNNNFDIGGLSIMDNLSKAGGSKLSTDFANVTNGARASLNESFLPEVKLGGTRHDKINHIVESKATPFRNALNEDKNIAKTPANSDYIIKTDQVTPMLDYESLTTPERNRELDKYGLKPFKRKRAIQLLTHIYNQTHPLVESCSEDLPSPSKKQKKDNLIPNTQARISPKKLMKSPAKSNATSPRKKSEVHDTVDKEILVETDKENEDIYRITNEVPEIKNIECSEEDWVFPKREKAKVHSCRIPLHIAFHNYVSSRQGLRSAILRYEPVSIDVVHRGLVDSGLKYDTKELLKFMDKKCITVKTADNNAKTNKKRY